MSETEAPRLANAVDVHVGRQIRMRRRVLGISQEKLAGALGLTFQQVQKYERGSNRVSASKLWAISGALDVPSTDYFFQGLPRRPVDGSAPAAGASDVDDAVQLMVDDGHGLRIAQAYAAMNGPQRRSLLSVAEAIAGAGALRTALDEAA